MLAVVSMHECDALIVLLSIKTLACLLTESSLFLLRRVMYDRACEMWSLLFGVVGLMEGVAGTKVKALRRMMWGAFCRFFRQMLVAAKVRLLSGPCLFPASTSVVCYVLLLYMQANRSRITYSYHWPCSHAHRWTSAPSCRWTPWIIACASSLGCRCVRPAQHSSFNLAAACEPFRISSS